MRFNVAMMEDPKIFRVLETAMMESARAVQRQSERPDLDRRGASAQANSSAQRP